RGRDPSGGRRGVPARGGRGSARARGVAPQRRESGAAAVKALVTGGRGGIGAAIVAALGDGEATVRDLPEFDVGEPEAWRALAARGIRLNAICPGITDTALVETELRGALDAPLMEPSFVAEAALRVLEDAETGRAWVVQPNRVEPFHFRGMPGPR